MVIPEIQPGRYIMAVNNGDQILKGKWGEWQYEFPHGQKGYNFTEYKPGQKFVIWNPNNSIVNNCKIYVMKGTK